MKKGTFVCKAGRIGLVILVVLNFMMGCGANNNGSKNNSSGTLGSSVKDFVDSSGCRNSGTPFGGGTGSSIDPYLLCSVPHLEAMATSGSASYYALTEDLDMTHEKHRCLGVVILGVFDGRDHTIRNFSVHLEMDQENGFLFGQLFSTNELIAEIKNLKLEEFSIETQSLGGTAALLGSNNGGRVTNVHATGTIIGRELVGGLVANNFGVIQDSSFDGIVQGHTEVGGIAGSTSGYSIHDCKVSGQVSADSVVGGIVGSADPQSELKGNLVNARVNGTMDFGTIVGRNKSL